MGIPEEAGIGHAPQRFAKAASEQMRVGLSPQRINTSAAVLVPTPTLSHREGDVSIVSRVRCRSCVARVNQRSTGAWRGMQKLLRMEAGWAAVEQAQRCAQS